MKEVVLDTETTGLSVHDGHRIVEIGCIELDNQIPTKKKFHCYLNPYSDKFLDLSSRLSSSLRDWYNCCVQLCHIFAKDSNHRLSCKY